MYIYIYIYIYIHIDTVLNGILPAKMFSRDETLIGWRMTFRARHVSRISRARHDKGQLLALP